jgi:response regulator RpfG family c-di-GMP phosphodiesterase
MLDEQQKLKRIIDFGLEITHVKDLDLILERILTEARQLANADAGSIYIKGNGLLHFNCTQNATQQKQLPPGRKLIYSTFTIPVDNKSIAGYVAASGTHLNIEDVGRLPDTVPYSFNRQYDVLSGYHTRSVLTIPLKTPRDDIVGVLQLINALDDSGRVTPFAAADEPLINSFGNHAATAIERAQMTRSIILRMVRMAELRDPEETGGHVSRVAAYSMEIYETWALKKGMPPHEIERNKDVLRMAAMLHDVGKIAISDSILKKPDRLDSSEFETMKQHACLGARLFGDKNSDFDEAAYLVALTHHERWDGGGYPGHVDPADGRPLPGYELANGAARGKLGEEIHPFGRVTAIADVYDALFSKRSYKTPWEESKIIALFQQEAGKQFDPEMVEAFFSCLEMLQNISKRYPS